MGVTGALTFARTWRSCLNERSKGNTLTFARTVSQLEERVNRTVGQGALAIRRIFSLVDMITKPKFSNCPNVLKIGLFR